MGKGWGYACFRRSRPAAHEALRSRALSRAGVGFALDSAQTEQQNALSGTAEIDTGTPFLLVSLVSIPLACVLAG